VTKYNARAEANYKAKLPIYLFYCCISEKDPNYSDFIEYSLNEDIIKKYASEYLQAERTELIEKIPIDTIYNFIKKWRGDNLFKYQSKKYIEVFEDILSPKDFNSLISKKECSYCGISLRQIEKLGREGKLQNKRADTRGYALEVDRISPNKEYTKENCCMSCYWCNNAKTDEFCVNEFKEIARGINLVWQKRLGNEKIVFPDKSDIWIP